MEVKVYKDKTIVIASFCELAGRFKRQSNNHSIYSCQVCEDQGGESKDKLYINSNTNKGYCFQCQSIFFMDSSYDLDYETKNFSEKLYKEVEDKISSYSLRCWTEPIADRPETLERLLSSRPMKHSLESLEFYGIRVGKTPSFDEMIIFPDTLNENLETPFFQYKVLDEDYLGPKYVTMTSPPLLRLDEVAKAEGRIILVEGIFDAIAVKGVPLFGRSISKSQADRLREYCFLSSSMKEIILMLDGSVSTSEVMAQVDIIKKVKLDIPLRVVSLPDKHDPEEVFSKNHLEDVLAGEGVIDKFDNIIKTRIEIY